MPLPRSNPGRAVRSQKVYWLGLPRFEHSTYMWLSRCNTRRPSAYVTQREIELWDCDIARATPLERAVQLSVAIRITIISLFTILPIMKLNWHRLVISSLLSRKPPAKLSHFVGTDEQKSAYATQQECDACLFGAAHWLRCQVPTHLITVPH
jgi:hypothetical protein